VREGECAPPRACNCVGHWMPGVSHMVPCCDEPHITQEEFDAKYADLLEDGGEVHDVMPIGDGVEIVHHSKPFKLEKAEE
jgi:hypothetical protein